MERLCLTEYKNISSDSKDLSLMYINLLPTI